MKSDNIIIMGICGCGKTTIGERLAKKTGRKFIDADDLHPRNNIEKMASGQPLDDEDRQPWLENIRDLLYSLESKNERTVIACSALKKNYRDQLRKGHENLTFLFLDGGRKLILKRMRKRKEHFMKVNMIESQLKILERPDHEQQTLVVSICGSIDEVVERSTQALNGTLVK